MRGPGPGARRQGRFRAIGVAVWVFAAPLCAQQPITSDRPGIGSGSAVLERGVIQVEAGVEYAGFDAGDALESRTLSVGQLLVRVGFSIVELELFGNSWARSTDDVSDEAESGLQDLGFGAKVPIARGVGGRADVSLQGVVSAPTGSAAFSDEAWGFDVNALADVALGGPLAVSLNAGINGTRGRSTDWSLIVTPAVSLAGGFGAYAGWAGTLSSEADTHVLEGGVTYLPRPDLQLDLNGGFDIDRDAWFVGGGVAVRAGAR
jgi:hypothetical protein